jgi:hypothetical protein
LTVRKPIIAVLAAVTVLLSATACSEIAEPDKVGLYYMEGQSDGYKFDHCIDPGAVDDALWNNSVVWLPNNIRTWNIAPEGGDTKVPITVASKPEPSQPSGVQVNVWSQTNLTLNTNCDGGQNSTLVKFWERLGRRYGADTDQGWTNMLLNTVVPALEKATRVAVRSFSADELVAGTVLPQVQAAVSKEFADELKRVTGEAYFCGPSFNRGSKDCPAVEILVKDVDYADAGIQEARNNKQKALEQAAAQVAEAEGKVRAAAAQEKLYQNPAWMEYELAKLQLQAVQACAQSQKCTIVMGVDGQILVNQG